MSRFRTEGFALIAVLSIMVLLMGIALAYSVLSIQNLRDTKNVTKSVSGFYAAEGGLNLRAERIRQKFVGYSRPSGTSPTTSKPCQGTNVGTLDLACDTTLKLGGHDVSTYVIDKTPTSPITDVVNPGEEFAGLNYQQYGYIVTSEAYGADHDEVQARLQMEFQSRLIPIFQFAAFYRNDMEINPGADMTLSGRVHTNGNLYLSPGATLTIKGQTTAQNIYRRRKDNATCTGTVKVSKSDSAVENLPSCGADNPLPVSTFIPFNGYVKVPGSQITMPEVSSLNPQKTNELFAKADLRIVAVKGVSSWALEVRDADNVKDVFATTRLNACNAGTAPAVWMNPASPSGSSTFYDRREKSPISLIEVDQVKLMDCIQGATAGTFKNGGSGNLTVDDTTGNGMVWHFSFADGNANTNTYPSNPETPTNRYQTRYGVRISNANKLGSTTTTAVLKGLTIVTNQAAYLKGNFNLADPKPASILADSINILSEAFTDSSSTSATIAKATPTTVNAAFMAGTDTTSVGKYNGGLENYPRFHEDWTGITFKYRGSFVSLGAPGHALGVWPGTGNTTYQAPKRDWDYDTLFNNVDTLPPLTPRFVYLRQILFARNY